MSGAFWAGKVAVVTGAAHGIGRAVAERLHGLGTAVVLVDIDREAAQGVAERLSRLAPVAIAIHCDLGVRAEVEALGRVVRERFGVAHYLVNCAYTNRQVRFLDIEDAFWDRVFAVNLKGMIACGQVFARLMMECGVAGRIVNFTSGAARLARPGFAAYGCSKAAVTHLTRYMAVELADQGILVNAVSPGLTASEWVASYERDPANADEHRFKMARLPLGRLAECEEIAGVVTYLLGPDAGYLTGAVVVADGGATAVLPQLSL